MPGDGPGSILQACCSKQQFGCHNSRLSVAKCWQVLARWKRMKALRGSAMVFSIIRDSCSSLIAAVCTAATWGWAVLLFGPCLLALLKVSKVLLLVIAAHAGEVQLSCQPTGAHKLGLECTALLDMLLNLVQVACGALCLSSIKRVAHFIGLKCHRNSAMSACVLPAILPCFYHTHCVAAELPMLQYTARRQAAKGHSLTHQHPSVSTTLHPCRPRP